jgi:hypothetical protein
MKRADRLAVIGLWLWVGACSLLDDRGVEPLPPMLIHAELPAVAPTGVIRAESVLTTHNRGAARHLNARVLARCAAGEDVRGHFAPTYLLIEALGGRLYLSGERVESAAWLVDHLSEAHAQRGLAARTGCWPPAGGRLLVVLGADTSLPTLGTVLEAAERAGFGQISFAVDPPGPGYRPHLFVPPGAERAAPMSDWDDVLDELGHAPLLLKRKEPCPEMEVASVVRPGIDDSALSLLERISGASQPPRGVRVVGLHSGPMPSGSGPDTEPVVSFEYGAPIPVVTIVLAGQRCAG